MKKSIFHLFVSVFVPIYFIGALFFSYINDSKASRRAGRGGKLKVGRGGALKGDIQQSQAHAPESKTDNQIIEVPQPIVKKTANVIDDDDDIKISSSTSKIELGKLKREKEDLQRQLNTLKTQKEMQKKNNKNNTKVAMCSVIGGKSKLIDMQAGVKSQEHKRDRILESVASVEKEIKELKDWIAENITKRDELKEKTRKAQIASTITGTAAIGAGAGAAIMYGKNKGLKQEVEQAKAGPSINLSGVSGGGLSLQSLSGKIDPGKVMEMGKGIIGSGKGVNGVLDSKVTGTLEAIKGIKK